MLRLEKKGVPSETIPSPLSSFAHSAQFAAHIFVHFRSGYFAGLLVVLCVNEVSGMGKHSTKSRPHRLHGQGSVRKWADGRWEVRLTCLVDGQSQRKSFYFCQAEEALAFLRTAATPETPASTEHSPPQGEPITLRCWLHTWLEAEKDRVKASTWRHYEGIVRCHLMRLGDRPVSDLNTAEIEAFYRQALRQGLSAGSLHGVHCVLHGALHEAVRQGVIPSNPAHLADLPPKPKPEATSLSPSQQALLVKSSQRAPHGVCVRLALATGLRIGELAALCWRDIDLSDRVLYVRHTQGNTGGELALPKTYHARRTIPLTASITADLTNWKQAQGETSPLRPVFPDVDGRPLRSAQIRREYKWLLASCGLPSYPFHALRHTFATRALERGMDFKTLSLILGHSSVSFTMDVYAHCSTAHIRREMQRMDYEYREPAPEALLNRLERCRQQLAACPDPMTKEQFRIACHISKRKARELLVSGAVLCQMTGKKTWKYRILKVDAMEYLERRHDDRAGMGGVARQYNSVDKT